jgi:dephospho-CoA kinase
MPAEKIVFGIVGMPSSGKGTIAAYFEEKYHAKKLRFSSALTDVLNRVGLEPDRDHQIKLSEVLREKFGEDILSRSIKIGIEKSERNLIIIDGVRREGDIEMFRALPNFHLLGVKADEQVRYERSRNRGEKPGEERMTFEQFQQLDMRSTEVSTKQLLDKTSIIFDNNGSFEDLYKQVDEYVSAMGLN